MPRALLDHHQVGIARCDDDAVGLKRRAVFGANRLEPGEFGELLVQNEASSAVWGMPGSIARAGLASAILHPFDLAARVAAATSRSG